MTQPQAYDRCTAHDAELAELEALRIMRGAIEGMVQAADKKPDSELCQKLSKWCRFLLKIAEPQKETPNEHS